MRKNPPRTKMESTAPKVKSRYLSSPSVSCHDHCKCVTKDSTETKPINLFPRRIPKVPPDRPKVEASNSVNKIKKSPSVVPKITTRNVKNNTIVAKDSILKKDDLTLTTKKGVSIEPKSRDLKPKSENSQTKKNNTPNSRMSTRRHSDILLPDAQHMPAPSPKIPKRRLSEIGIRPKKDVVSVSNNTSLVRDYRLSKNEPKKDSKISSMAKKPNSIKPTVSSPKRGANLPPLRSYKSLPHSELKSPRKSKPMRPIKEVFTEKASQVVEPNGVESETTKTEIHVTPDSSPTSDEKVLTPLMEDDTTNETLVVETTECSTKNESHITPDSSPNSEEKTSTDNHIGVHEGSLSIEDDNEATTDGQLSEIVADLEVIDTKEAIRIGKLEVEIADCSLDDLAFRRGKFFSPHSEGSSPRKHQFVEGKEFDEQETEKAEKIILRRMSFDGVIIHHPEIPSVNVDLKHQEMAEKEAPSLSNKALEETASKLIEMRKSKVKALVGAFENIVSSTTQIP